MAALDLVSLLASGLATGESVNALSSKTSASDDQVTAALLAALPSMLGKMKTNASTEKGADSLMEALDQHDLSDADIVKLIKAADEADGVKILNHLYGSSKEQEAEAEQIAKKTGLSNKQVATIMACAAPALLTAVASAKKKQTSSAKVSSAKTSSKKSNSDDLTELLTALMSTGSSSKKTSKKDDGMGLDDILALAGALSGTTSGKKTSKKDDGFGLDDVLTIAGALSGGKTASKPSSSKKSSEPDLTSVLGTLLKGKKLF